AIRLKKDFLAAHYNRGRALMRKGRLDEAIQAYHQTIRLKEGFAEAHCNLGQALRDKGLFLESLASYRRGHELGSSRRGWPYPSEKWVQEAQHLVDLERKLPALLAGMAGLANGKERLNLAWMCLRPSKRLFAHSARLYAEAFGT